MRTVILASLLILAFFSAGFMWTSAEVTAQQPCLQTASIHCTTAPTSVTNEGNMQQPCLQTAPSNGGETLPPSSTLTVVVCSSYSYKATNGTTVVLGDIQNNNNFPVAGVKVGVTFEDPNNNVLEYKTGTTLLQVVEPNSMAPFSISSTNANPSITQVAVDLAGFTPASAKDQALTIPSISLHLSDNLILAGILKNGGTSTATNTNLYLITYDAFQRVVGIDATTVPNTGAGNTANFTITSTPSSRAKTFQIIAESDNYQSLPTNVTNIIAALPVMVSSTNVTNPSGSPYSTIPVYAPVKISSNLNYLLDSVQSYVYYVQVKKFGGEVEFIGNTTGVFLGGNDQDHTESVSWTPDAAGSYYIETYVWDSNGVPISSSGTKINIALVK
ncbi:MAG: hypothetical protein WAN47_02920 [Nitrosotalea sp.]